MLDEINTYRIVNALSARIRANKSKSCKKAINIYMQDSYLIKNRKGTHGTNFFYFSSLMNTHMGYGTSNLNHLSPSLTPNPTTSPHSRWESSHLRGGIYYSNWNIISIYMVSGIPIVCTSCLAPSTRERERERAIYKCIEIGRERGGQIDTYIHPDVHTQNFSL